MATANVQENITQHKKNVLQHYFDQNRKRKCTRKYYITQKKRFFSIILIEIAKVNVQENITQHIKTFFVHNFDLNRNYKCTRKYNTTQKKRFCLALF